MKAFGKILLILLVAVVVLLVAAISFTIGWRPILGPKARTLTDRKFEPTPPRLERGKYIFNSAAGCADCHSEHDPSSADHPVLPSMHGAGEIMFLDGLPGRIVASNLTPDPETGAGTWTDDQLARAIREGIGHDGRALFPIMPYEHYKSMSDEDLASVIVYIRSLPPVHHELPKTEIIFPVKYLIRSVPEPINAPVVAPGRANQILWGAYVVNMAGCVDCHTPMDSHGQPLPGLQFGGGQVFKGTWISTASANITPDASGIGYYDEALFLQVLRTGYVKARKLAWLMPVEQYKGMTDEDLKAAFAYLRTVQPVKHRVDNTEPPTYCRLCRANHGAGDQN
ncbi:MAG TPA: c-type cytochrome [Terriglobales bacterium]|nr:c-type cytochrome [Terriglobales bacterium]